MNFSSNRYGALDQLFDLDIAMTANGYSNNGSNNPSSLSYSPEAASLLGTGVYNPTSAARGGGTDLPSSVYHHSTAPHHSLITAPTTTNNNSNSATAAASPYTPAGGQYFANNNNNSGSSFGGNHGRNLSPFGGNSNNSTSAAAAAAASTALRQFAASFEPIPIRQQGSASQGQQRHQNDQERTPLEELLMLGTGAYINPTPSVVPASVSSYDPISMHHDAFFVSQDGQSGGTRRNEEEWMKEISLTIPSLSLEPISGSEVANRIKSCMEDVIRRYIPCVDFLVQCQQELRKGLAAAQVRHTGRRYRQTGMSPKHFFHSYIDNLPQRFRLTNERRMESTALQEAIQGLEKLRSDAKQVVNQGCEAVKNSFLGGMKEGESWGLRKWLSRNGNALRVCTDLECILKACKELDKSKDTTKKLAAFLRPLAKQTLDKLKKDVPPSYQERSSAHPYLPFFHRLEGALRNMSQFDPEDDGIICLDDSDDEEEPIIVEAPPPKRKPAARKRKPVEAIAVDAAPPPPQKRVFDNNAAAGFFADTKQEANTTDDIFAELNDEAAPAAVTATTAATTEADDGSSSGESDVDSVIQIVAQAVADDNVAFGDPGDGAGWRCTNCSFKNPSAALETCQGCGEPSYNSDLVGTLFSPAFGDDLDLHSVDRSSEGFDEIIAAKPKKAKKKRRASVMNEMSHRFPLQASQEELNRALGLAQSLAAKAERLAAMFENMPQSDLPYQMIRARKGESLWDDLYATALRIFSDILRQPDAVHFVEPVNEMDLIKSGHPPYTSIIKNPLCFREILATLIDLEHMDEDHSGCYRWFNGLLPRRGLSQWNMWRGSDLLQAVDLVFLNSLAYGKICGEGRSRNRSRTNDLRKQLWNQIHETVNACVDDTERRRQCTPTRRSETSGFVVEKKKVR